MAYSIVICIPWLLMLFCTMNCETSRLIVDPVLDAQNRSLINSSRATGTIGQRSQLMNLVLEAQNPDSVNPPDTDIGEIQGFKYPMAFAHVGHYSGGWTRQVNVNDFPIAVNMAGVQMRLFSGAVRELHWHPENEWAFVFFGTCRVTLVDEGGYAYVGDVTASDLWFFPAGRPHSIQGLGDDGCFFLLVFDSGNFSEADTFLLTDWMGHVPLSVLSKNFQVPESVFKNLPTTELYMFASELPRPLKVEQHEVAIGTGLLNESIAFYTTQMKPNYTRLGGNVKIIDNANFPITTIAAAIVTLKPGGLRELHWHPNADEWTYFVSGMARVGMFEAGNYPANSRTMDFQEGDIGYIPKDNPHYVENTGDCDLIFLEVFPSPTFQDISLAEWLAHTPTRLVNEHIHTGEAFINAIYNKEAVIRPL